LAGLLAPSAATAGPFFGDWTWFWHPSSDCPTGDYSALHYQVPDIYKARALVHPSHLDQYPPGPAACPTANYDFSKYRCRQTPPLPTAPYTNAEGYYGRAVGLPFALP